MQLENFKIEKNVFSKEMIKRYNKAKKTYDNPVMIVTQSEAEEVEKGFFKKEKNMAFSS